MKKLGLVLASAVIGLQVNVAQAGPISIDVSQLFGNAVGTNRTSLFESLTLQQFNPVSTYTAAGDCAPTPNDISGCTFTNVVDTASNISVTALNPLTDPGLTVGFNTAWGLSLDWELFGTPIQIGNDFLGAFNAGSVDISIFRRVCQFDPITGVPHSCVNQASQSVMSIDITGSSVGTPGNSEVGIEIFGNISSVAQGFFFASNGLDFYDLLQTQSLMFAIANSDIKNLDNAPGSCSFDEDSNTTECSRQTLLTSVDVRFEVPEPSSIAILGAGLLGMGFAARRRRSNKAA